MTKSRFTKKSFIALSAGLCCVPGAALAVSTYTDSLADYAGNFGGTGQPNPGDSYEDISQVLVTNNATDILFQIQLNPSVTVGTTTNNTDILTTGQSYGKYQIGLETVPGAGSTALVNPNTNRIGISTGMNYFINGWTNQGGGGTDANPDFGDDRVYTYSGGAWNYLSGNANGIPNTYVDPISPSGSYYSPGTDKNGVSLSQTSITMVVSLASLGLNPGSAFHFDVWTTFSGGDAAYDALDSGPAATHSGTGASPYFPWTGTYDSATASGSTYSTTTYTVATPTFTWNNFPASTGGNGTTWATGNSSTNFNWNNGIFADTYTEGSNVVFNDANSGNYAVTLNATVNPASVNINNSTGNYAISGTGQIAGAGSLTKLGTGTATISTPNTYTGGTIVNGGTLVIGPTTVANTVALPNGAVTIGAAGNLTLADNSSASTPFVSSSADITNQLMKMTSLSITTGGVLDVRNNHFNVADPGGLPSDATFTTLYGYIQSAITSTEGLAGYGVGLVDGNDSVSGSPVSANQIEVAYTLQGDANLDGKVDATDFGIFAPNFGATNFTLGWEGGDFNYSGKVDATNFGLFAPNFGQSDSGTAISLPAADYAALDAFAAANGLSLTSVPEPASLGLLTLGAVGIMARRRRINN